MKYNKVIDGIFLSRPNRFIAMVDIGGREEAVHVKNTGRCRELLVPGAKVYLSCPDNPKRKTNYDLIAVEKTMDGTIQTVNIDSQAPNHAAALWLPVSGLFARDAIIRSEVTLGDSRFDFCITEGERRSFLEVKGVTLEQDGVALFPDAPTERGVKHIEELIACQKDGYRACLLFVVQMKGVSHVCPNDDTHPAFGEALHRAKEAGVTLLAVDCQVSPAGVFPDEILSVCLG